jgi:hypothetical protein
MKRAGIALVVILPVTFVFWIMHIAPEASEMDQVRPFPCRLLSGDAPESIKDCMKKEMPHWRLSE